MRNLIFVEGEKLETEEVNGYSRYDHFKITIINISVVICSDVQFAKSQRDNTFVQ
jgi:hypothetical protein